MWGKRLLSSLCCLPGVCVPQNPCASQVLLQPASVPWLERLICQLRKSAVVGAGCSCSAYSQLPLQPKLFSLPWFRLGPGVGLSCKPAPPLQSQALGGLCPAFTDQCLQWRQGPISWSCNHASRVSNCVCTVPAQGHLTQVNRSRWPSAPTLQ